MVIFWRRRERCGEIALGFDDASHHQQRAAAAEATEEAGGGAGDERAGGADGAGGIADAEESFDLLGWGFAGGHVRTLAGLIWDRHGFGSGTDLNLGQAWI